MLRVLYNNDLRWRQCQSLETPGLRREEGKSPTKLREQQPSQQENRPPSTPRGGRRRRTPPPPVIFARRRRRYFSSAYNGVKVKFKIHKKLKI